MTDFSSSPRGRHSTFGRRRRSTRVRRYVPATLPAPEAVSAPVLRPAPPSQSIRAEEVALTRPYYAAHERERERVRKPRVAVPPPRGHQLARVPASAEAAVLQARGLTVSDEVRRRVESCTDLETLKTWVPTAVTVERPEHLFD